MYFKAKIVDAIVEDESSIIHQLFYNYSDKEIILFENHEFEVERSAEGMIDEITYCNQCVNTFDIEEVFLKLLAHLLQKEQKIILIDSEGFEEEMVKEDLEEIIG